MMSNVVNLGVVREQINNTIFDRESELYFHVREEPLYLQSVTDTEQRVEGYKALTREIRDDTGWVNVQLLTIVGSTYHVIQNKELFETIESRMLKEFSPKQLRDVRVTDKMAHHGCDCFREYVFPHIRTDVDGRQIQFRIVVYNSFGGLAFRILVGAMDIVCTNGAVIGEYDFMYHRHTKGLTIPSIDNRIMGAINVFFKQAELWQKWRKRAIADGDVIKFLTELGISQKKVNAIYARWLTESRDQGKNVWALYSAFTYYSSHSTGDFALRDTGNDHAALTMFNREREVKDIATKIAHLARVA